MDESFALEQLPMPLSYFRLILGCFGDTPDRRAAILAGTGVTDEMLEDPSAEISLLQQVRQNDNVADLFGEGWPLRAPELWNHAAHGPLTIAATTAPDVPAMIEVLTQFGFVRAPIYRMSLRRGPNWSQLDYELTVPLEDRHWRPIMEVTFIGTKDLFAWLLAGRPTEIRYAFACAEPAYADEVRALLGDGVVYGAPQTAIQFPTAWLDLKAPLADAALHGVALGELQAAAKRITAPLGLRGRVERLLRALPASRLTAGDVARATGVSQRTLVRWLAETGVSYRQLRDLELRARAERLLREGGLSRRQMAEVLGYTDRTSFSRACRRWFGSASAPPPRRRAFAARTGRQDGR